MRTNHLNEEIKQTKWQKFKEFFKRHWLNIVKSLSFISAIILTILKLTDRLPKRNKSGNGDFREQLDGLERDTGEARTEVNELGDISNTITDTTNSIKHQTGTIRDENRDAIKVSKDVGEGIQRIKQLIEAERERNKEAEV